MGTAPYISPEQLQGLAVEAGAHDVSWFLQDSDLDNLRDDPRFDALIEQMKTEG